MMVKKLSFLLILASQVVWAQEWEFVTRNDLGQRITAIDVGTLGKVYVGTERGNVYSFQADGTEDKLFSSSVFQPVTSLDVSNGLKPFVFYASSGEFEFLERFSAQSRVYEVNDFGITSADCASLGRDGTLWFVTGDDLVQVQQQTGGIMSKTKVGKGHRGKAIKIKIGEQPFILSDLGDLSFGDTILGSNVRGFSLTDDGLILLDNEGLKSYFRNYSDSGLSTPPKSNFSTVVRSGDYYHFIENESIFVYRMK